MKTLILLLTLVAVTAFAQHQHHHPETKPKAPPSVHGMFLFGKKKIYLSHLPMFHMPHDYQALFEVTLDTDSLTTYLEASAASAQTIYTLVPEKFILPEMVQNPHTFKAQIYSGHFERGGQQITVSTEVKISKVLFFKKLSQTTPLPSSASAVVIGNDAEQFMIHQIAGAPDFDQIVQIQPLHLFDSILKASPAILLNLPHKEHKTPLLKGEKIQVETVFEKKTFLLEVQQELYLEFSDLVG